MKLVVIYGSVALVAVVTFLGILSRLIRKEMFSDWLGLPFLCSSTLLVYLFPRFVGAVRNGMKVTVRDDGLLTPLGRHVTAKTIAAASALQQEKSPHWVSFRGFLIPVRIFVSFYEDPEKLIHALKAFQKLSQA